MGNHMCALNDKGQIKCWGFNDSGQLGQGDSISRGSGENQMGENLPFIQLGTGLIADSVSVGSIHTCAHFTSNVVKCWGYNDEGRLGLGDTNNRGDESGEMGDNLPTIKLGTTSTPSKVICGSVHTCVLFANKKVKCFGNNGAGQLGYEKVAIIGENLSGMDDTLAYVDLGTGVLVDSLYTFSSGFHNCVIIATSKLMKCWGYNQYAQLGYGDLSSRGREEGTMGNNLTAIDLGIEDRVKLIAVGDTFTCALRIDDVLLCFGQNTNGQLGSGSKNDVVEMGASLVATPYDAGKKIKQIVAGVRNTCVLFDDNLTVKCIGQNTNGELGQGDMNNRGDLPTNMIPDIPAINLGTGSLQISSLKTLPNTNFVIFTDFSVKCFGFGANGELGSGSSNSIGNDLYEMGTNLTFVELFPTQSPTTKPTRSPGSRCNFAKKKRCNKRLHCDWKKNECIVFDCANFTTRADCVADLRCDWKKGTCRFQPK